MNDGMGVGLRTIRKYGTSSPCLAGPRALASGASAFWRIVGRKSCPPGRAMNEDERTHRSRAERAKMTRSARAWLHARRQKKIVGRGRVRMDAIRMEGSMVGRTAVIGFGAVGRATASLLAARGDAVRIVQRREPDTTPAGCVFHAADLEDREATVRACGRARTSIRWHVASAFPTIPRCGHACGPRQ